MRKKGLAIVIGASSGIGECVAKGLAADGYRPVLIARNGEKLRRLAGSISASGHQRPLVYPLDITDHEMTSGVMDEIVGLETPIDVIVHSAAAYVKGSLGEDIESVRHILEANLVSHYAVLQALIPILKQQRHGHVFTIASRAGKYGYPGVGIYGASKSALIGLSESLYRELAPLNIKVTTLCPGWVNTRMARDAQTPFQDEEMIQPEDILQTIRFLLSLSAHACIKEIVIESSKSVL
jgi:short-subunit dehydrogenase